MQVPERNRHFDIKAQPRTRTNYQVPYISLDVLMGTDSIRIVP